MQHQRVDSPRVTPPPPRKTRIRVTSVTNGCGFTVALGHGSPRGHANRTPVGGGVSACHLPWPRMEESLKKRQVKPVQPLGLGCGASHRPAAASALRWSGGVETWSRTRISAAASPRARVALAPSPPPRHPVPPTSSSQILISRALMSTGGRIILCVRTNTNPNQVHRIAHAQRVEFTSNLVRTHGQMEWFCLFTTSRANGLASRSRLAISKRKKKGQGWPIWNNTNLTRIPA